MAETSKTKRVEMKAVLENYCIDVQNFGPDGSVPPLK
jgi:hypothetical protein